MNDRDKAIIDYAEAIRLAPTFIEMLWGAKSLLKLAQTVGPAALHAVKPFHAWKFSDILVDAACNSSALGTGQDIT